MPIEIRYDIRGKDAALRLLSPNLRGVLDPAFRDSALHVQDILKRYPERGGNRDFAALATPGQRRAFFAKLRRGEWTGRTGTLGRSWDWRFARPGLGAIVYNPTAYAHWVQSQQMQARIHRRVWQNTEVAALRQSEGYIVNRITMAVQRGL